MDRSDSSHRGETAVRPHAAASRRPQVARPGPGLTRHYLFAAGAVRSYCLHVPPTCHAGGGAPLVLNLHAICADAEQQERLSRLCRRADEAGCIVAYPEATGTPPVWRIGERRGGEEDVAFLGALVEHVQRRFGIDGQRVYAVGMSNGAGMVNRLAHEMAERLAAVALVAGAYPAWNGCRPARPVPLLAFHGTADRVVPYGGLGRALPPIRQWAAAWAAHNRCGGQPALIQRRGAVLREVWQARGGASVTLYTIVGGGHEWPGSPGLPADSPASGLDATAIIWEFFCRHGLRQGTGHGGA